MHLMLTAVPAIEITDDTDSFCVRSPHREVHTRYAIDGAQVCAHLVVSFPVLAFAVEMKIEFSKQGIVRVGVVHDDVIAGCVLSTQLIFRFLLVGCPRQNGLEHA